MTEAFVSTIVQTIDGSAVQATVTSERIVQTTTGFVTSTPSPSDGGDSDESDGMSSNTKAILGGVLGGIGGAILLGGIIVVVWRMWGRRRRNNDFDADDVYTTGAAETLNRDKGSSGPQSPFKETLDQYHGHGKAPVNTAANF